MSFRIRIATRKSALALWQANYIKQCLEQQYADLTVEIIGITTSGDKILLDTLSKSGGKGLFTKELEQALFDKQADIAVHSMKDVPMDLPEGMTLAAICKREDPRDAFISNAYTSLAELPQNAKIGTASLRRACLIHALRPDVIVEPLRGNVDTRLRRLDEKNFSAIVLAAAGLVRLGLGNRITEYLSPLEFIPAAGQGALGIECRADDVAILQRVKFLDHLATRYCVVAERAMNKHLEGGCQVPLAAYAELDNDNLTLQGMVGTPDGESVLRTMVQGKAAMGATLGIRAAEKLLDQGAKKILQVYTQQNNGFIS